MGKSESHDRKDQPQELEVKFHILDLTGVEHKLQAMGAVLSQARIHETNLRFDTPDDALKQRLQVLRLRQDTAARLTFKGPGRDQEGVRARLELEFIVSDFEAARAFLEALGYQVSMMYEKHRATYEFMGCHVTLDEMPYGAFIEIEGPEPAEIRAAAHQLGLNWERRVLDSYTGIFDRLRAVLGLAFSDLSFENFKDKQPQLNLAGVFPADG